MISQIYEVSRQALPSQMCVQRLVPNPMLKLHRLGQKYDLVLKPYYLGRKYDPLLKLYYLGPKKIRVWVGLPKKSYSLI